ncbi:protein MLP1 homolog [Pyrus x bretschneideri]|uniref:protein MLP1 homolog n=1 Tax=Pyrus x bretschneideri TaxID=225117 RepID=UPI00202EF0B6|nr:protein MLP1 homolog [Pyrus x bretschneideri]
MDLPQEIDDYIKESIDHSLGLPVSTNTLELKLRCSEEAKRRLQNQYSLLLSKLKEKEQVLERYKAEASMNAQALRKFVEENQRLASECAHLVTQCNKWERECSLYDHDREALMDFGNEADQRAKEAEIRVQELEDEVRELRDELGFYKHKLEMHLVESSAEDTTIEEKLLDSVLATLINKDEAVSARAFLEANKGNESCGRLLKMWKCLKPSSQKVLSLVAEVKTLEKDKEHLRINLRTAEEEVKLLFEENKVLDVENKRLLRLYQKERNHSASGGKHIDSASAKSNKRKSSSKISSPIQGKIDFSEQEPARQPLSPLRCNSPNSRTYKK